MTDFDLGGAIPGVTFSAPLLVPNTGASVSARLTGGVFVQPDSAPSIDFAAAYNSAVGMLTLDGTFNPAQRFLGGILELTRLTLDVPCVAGAGGRMTADPVRPPTASGTARWTGTVPAALGAPGDVLAFDVTLTSTGIALNLSAPTALATASVELRTAAVRVDVLPAEQALLLSAAGQAQLANPLGDQVEQLLGQVFGIGNAPALTDPAFAIRQKLRLADLARIGPPTLALQPDWSGGGAPDLPGATSQTLVDLGLPQFNVTFPDGTAPHLSLSFRGCRLRFPRLPGFETLALDGNLSFVDDGIGGFTLGFEPTVSAVIELPEFVRMVLATISWAAVPPDLGTLADQLGVSLREFGWYELFLGLMPPDGDTVDGGFGAALDGILDAALGLVDAPALPDLFALAFSALAPRSDELYTLVAGAWSGRGASLADAIDLILRLEPTLPPAAFARFLRALLAEVDGLVAAVLGWGAERPTDSLDDFLSIWIGVLAAALAVLDADALADLLMDALGTAGGTIAEPMAIGDVPLLAGLPGLTNAAFRLPRGVVLTGLGLSSLLLSSEVPTAGTTSTSFIDGVTDLANALERAIRWLLAPIADLGVPAPTGKQVLGLLCALCTNARDSPESELTLLRLSRIPILGQLLTLSAAAVNAFTKLPPWTELLWRPIEDDATKKVKRLPKPRSAGDGRPAVKYLIFSDTHRDQASDDRGYFRRGSINHFSDNAELYADILQWAYNEGYTVLEAGDCEELWFIRDFSEYTGPKDQLEAIMASHSTVYDRLKELHDAGRYFRCYGNHDSYLRTPATRRPLEDHFGNGLEIYDWFIIDGVKTMTEHGVLDFVRDLGDMSWAPRDRLEAWVRRVAEGRLGLDSEPYTDTLRLIVTHGHQFDFWNCDENNLVGKMFANGVGVLVDIHDDPLLDLEGIAFGGAPVFDFQAMLANLPVFSGFLSYNQSRAFAHRIQHMHDSDRVLINDIFYWEVIPALMAAWAMPIHLRSNWPDGAPEHRWKDRVNDPADAAFHTNFLKNAICLGHTHYPQSRPYYDIAAVLFGPAKALVDLLREVVAGVLLGFKPPINFINAQYYNSGTASWMEGVVWAVEVDEFGQARSIFWTRDTRVDRPQEMDWELQRWSPERRAALDDLLGSIEDDVQQRVGPHRADVAGTVGGALSTAVLVALRDQLVGDLDVTLAEATTTDADAVSQATGQVTSVVVQLLLNLLARQFGEAVPRQNLRISVPLDGVVAGRLSTLERLLDGVGDIGSDVAGLAAALWYAAGEQLPFVNGGPQRGVTAAEYPVLRVVLSLLPMLPSFPVGFPVTTHVTVAGGALTLTLTVG